MNLKAVIPEEGKKWKPQAVGQIYERVKRIEEIERRIHAKALAGRLRDEAKRREAEADLAWLATTREALRWAMGAINEQPEGRLWHELTLEAQQERNQNGLKKKREKKRAGANGAA